MLSVSSAAPASGCPEEGALAVLRAAQPFMHSTCCLAVSSVLLLLLLSILAPVWLLLLLLFRFFTCVPLPFWCPPATRSFLRPVDHLRGGARSSSGTPCCAATVCGHSVAKCWPPETSVGLWGEMCAYIHWFGAFELSKPTVVYCHGWEPGTAYCGIMKNSQANPAQTPAQEPCPEQTPLLLSPARESSVNTRQLLANCSPPRRPSGRHDCSRLP